MSSPDHGLLLGLADNDHPQYALASQIDTDHGNLTGLFDDDHPQYLLQQNYFNSLAQNWDTDMDTTPPIVGDHLEYTGIQDSELDKSAFLDAGGSPTVSWPTGSWSGTDISDDQQIILDAAIAIEINRIEFTQGTGTNWSNKLRLWHSDDNVNWTQTAPEFTPTSGSLFEMNFSPTTARYWKIDQWNATANPTRNWNGSSIKFFMTIPMWEPGTPYVDADAVTAMGVVGDGNDLNHVKYTDTQAAAKILADGLYLRLGNTGTSTLQGTLNMEHSHPRTDNTYDLGTNSLTWQDLFVYNIKDEAGTTRIDLNSWIRMPTGTAANPAYQLGGTTIGMFSDIANSTQIKFGSFDFRFSGGGGFAGPDVDNTISLGNGSLRFIDVWAFDTSINASDEREKKNIDIIDGELASKLIEAIDPIGFVRKERKRTHWGFGAFQIRDALIEVGIDPTNQAVWIDPMMDTGPQDPDTIPTEDTPKALRTTELLPIVWRELQTLRARVALLEV